MKSIIVFFEMDKKERLEDRSSAGTHARKADAAVGTKWARLLSLSTAVSTAARRKGVGPEVRQNVIRKNRNRY